VPAVGLAVEPSGGDACVEVGCVRGADLEYVRDVEAEQELDPVVSGDSHVAEIPQFIPRPRVMLEGFGVRPVAAHGLASIDQRLVDGGVARGIEGYHLLDAHRLLLLDPEGVHLVNVVLHLVEAAVGAELLVPPVDAGAGRLGDVDARLAGPGLQGDDLGAERPGGDRVEVPPFELPVTDDTPVRDPAVQRRYHLHIARPVLRRDGPLHGRLVHVSHADVAARLERGLAACPVAYPQATLELGVAHVVFVAVGEELDVFSPEGLLTFYAQLEQEPVREVDQVLVQDRHPGHDGGLPVEATVGVRARIAHSVGLGPRQGTPRAKVAVAGGSQRLAQTLLLRIE
jgi:hypothetical protein